MLRAWGVVVLTQCLLLFLVVLQAQDTQSAPAGGQGAVKTGNDSQQTLEVTKKVLKDLEETENGKEVEEEAKALDPELLNMYNILGIAVVMCVLLLWIIVCCIGMSWLREKDMIRILFANQGTLQLKVNNAGLKYLTYRVMHFAPQHPGFSLLDNVYVIVHWGFNLLVTTEYDVGATIAAAMHGYCIAPRATAWAKLPTDMSLRKVRRYSLGLYVYIYYETANLLNSVISSLKSI
ncbi:hypothetical protein DUI87_16267 [Hirundo rustica rustica]|uniref:Uncharacterized protein n=1 Tax=Hirundo rustica rustica TaxID=333673 RepID=A0A3M0K6X8_HIRRU|nr:hypothetical protein DUI87_16267 [Hirundo rustica rustica]